MSVYGNNPIQGNVPTSLFGKAIANEITPTDGQVITFVAANDRWEPLAPGAGADTKVVVFENLVQVGAVARRLNYSNVDDFIITEDVGNDVFTFAINRNAADGIAGLDASSRLAKANQHLATVYNDQANIYTAGAKQSVTHDATTAGFQLVGAAGDPSVLVDGDVWHNTTSNLLFARLIGVSREFVFRTLAQILTGKSIDANTNTLTNIGASEVIADIITGQTLLAGAADPAADELLIHDNSLGALRRVVPNNLGIAGGTDEDVQVNLASVAVGVPRHLNFVNASHFSAVEDAPGNEIDITLDTNVANGIAALNASNQLTSNLANLNQLPALTINRALESDGSGVIIASAVTNTELNLLAGQVTTLVNTATASAYAAGVKQSFLHDATNAGLRFVGAAGDPSVLVNGDVWHNTTSNLLFARLNATTREFVFRTLAQILTGKSIDANTNTLTNIGASEVIADIITGQTLAGAIDPDADELLIHDNSLGALRRVTPNNLGLGGTGTLAIVREAGVDISSNRLALNFTNADDFTIVDDGAGNEAEISILRNVANGIAGLNASNQITSNLANLNQLPALTINRALESDGSGVIIASAVTNTELNLLAGQVATLVNTATASAYAAGVKQSFLHDATNAGLRFVGAAGDPGTLVNGDMWHNTTSNLLFARLNAVTREFLFRTLAQIITNKTIDANNNTITNIGASEIIADIITGLTDNVIPVDPAADEVMIHDSSAGGLRRAAIEELQKKLPSVLTAQGAILPASAAPTGATVAGANHSFRVLDYPDGSTTSAFWDFRMPSNIGLNLDLTFIITWISTVTSGDVDFNIAILGRADSEPYDAALTNATTVTLVTDPVAGDINRTTITINASGVDEDDDMIVRLQRLGGADTMVADARFINCRMLYA